MYWSIYDTMVLITGVLTAAIAILPMVEIPAKTRLIAAIVGGGLIVAALILGGLPSFTYPAIVFVAPVLALVAGGVVVRGAMDQRKRSAAIAVGGHGAELQYGESGHAATQTVSSTAVEAHAKARDPRDVAWESLYDPATTSERLAEIAAVYPEFAPRIAEHPQAYDALREWAASTAVEREP